MKPLYAFQPRERRLALIAVTLIGCWGFLAMLLQPLWARVRELQLHVDTQTDRFESLSQLMTRQPAIEREYQALMMYMEPADVTGAEGAFLNELEALSRSAQVQLNLKPRKIPGRDDQADRFEVELDVEGSQQRLLAFLDVLLRMPTLIEFERLRLSGVPGKETTRATIVIHKLSL